MLDCLVHNKDPNLPVQVFAILPADGGQLRRSEHCYWSVRRSGRSSVHCSDYCCHLLKMWEGFWRQDNGHWKKVNIWHIYLIYYCKIKTYKGGKDSKYSKIVFLVWRLDNCTIKSCVDWTIVWLMMTSFRDAVYWCNNCRIHDVIQLVVPDCRVVNNFGSK